MTAAITANLLRATDQIGKLTSVERALLLRRAAATIRSYHMQLGSAAALADPCGTAFDLAAMARGIDLFDSTTVSELMCEAVVVIGMLQEQQDVFPALVGRG